jgi:hypothetical protein
MQTDTTELYLKDKMGRIVFKIIGDKVMMMRLPDMDSYTKTELIALFTEFTGEKENKLRAFLDFKDDGSGENEFCS